MMHPKRAVLSGLVLALAVLQGGCRKAQETPKADDGTRRGEPATATPPSTATVAPAGGRAPGAKIKIAFSAPSADHGWTGAISVNAKKQAAKYDDVEFSLTQAPTAADQVSQLN